MSDEYMETEEEFVARRDGNGELYVTNVPEKAIKPVTYFFYDPSEFAWDAIKYFASLDEAVAACNKAIQDMNDGNWGMDEEDLERFIVGTVTHKARVHKHTCTLEESESGTVDAAPGTEIWECKLEEIGHEVV